MSLITGYPIGSNITVQNVHYQRPHLTTAVSNDGYEVETYTRGTIFINYRDNTSGERKIQIIDDPDFEYWIEKNPNLEGNSYNKLFIPKENATVNKCKYRTLEKSLAHTLHKDELYRQNKQAGDWKANREFHLDPNIFWSDVDIRDYYRFKFGQEYKNESYPLSKTYLDIEADIINIAGDFPELGEAPINCITVYIEQENTTYTFILREPKNPLVRQFEESLNQNWFAKLYNKIVEHLGGEDKAKDLGVFGLKSKVYMFDKEIDLIASVFRMIHSKRPDFVLAWNMAFDIPYIIARIITLSYNPIDIMCDPSISPEYKEASYFIDERHKNELPQRNDFATITGFPVWLDQMIQFSSIRKAIFTRFAKTSLDYIADLMAGIHKYDYSHITTDIAKLPWLAFDEFVIYNILDTVAQKCIESKCKDIDYVFMSALDNNTSYNKVHRQTVYLINRISKEFYNNGFIIGNNINRNNPKPPKYAGAIVTEPLMTSDDCKMVINGVPAMIADNTIDQDYASLYPNIALEDNIAPNTQYGKLNIYNKWYIEYADDDGKIRNYWVLDYGNAHDYPSYKDEAKKKEVLKQIDLYEDEDYTRFIKTIPCDKSRIKTILYTKLYDNENVINEEKYERSGEFLENLVTDHHMEFCKRYFKLADWKQFLLEDLPEFLKLKGLSLPNIKVNLKPLIFHKKQNKYNLIHHIDNTKKINLLHFSGELKQSKDEYQERIRRNI